MQVQPTPSGFGATLTGIDLTRALSPSEVEAIRAAWLAHQVVCFPDQTLSHQDLERFTRCIGPFGHDPYVAPIAGHPHILEVRREPDEAVTPFGGSWHSDWSFQRSPPSATLLHAKIVPPVGGDTLFADGCAAFAALPADEQAQLRDLTALHSARRPYSHEGYVASRAAERSMTILPSDSAQRIQEHPLIRTHPETGREVLWVNAVYTVGIKGMSEGESAPLLARLCAHATQPCFVYRHRWSAGMLTMWDNRSVQHCARGGYDGHRRVMHRTTVAGEQPV